MSQIGLVEVDPTTVPTPPAGAKTIFVDNTSHVVSVIDETGTISPLGGASGLAVGGVLTGTLPDPGMAATTVTAAAYGSATTIPTFTVGVDGRLTAAAGVLIAIPESQVTSLVSDLAAKAPLASPTFTGTPAAPTPSGGDNTTKIATTAFVTTAVGAGGVVSSVFTRTGAVVASSGDYTVSQVTGAAPLASPTFTGTVTVPTTTNATDAAQKAYVDAALNGLSWKQEVRIASAAAGTLITSFANGQTVDGVAVATGDRILIKNQVSGAENGIYIVAVAGAPTRSTDAATGAELVNATCYVSEGTANADTQWTCSTNAPITPGVTALTFVQSGGGATYSADETTLHLSSTTFSIKTDVPLPGNPTAATQTPANNSTRIATTAYVDSAVATGGGGPSAGSLGRLFVFGF